MKKIPSLFLRDFEKEGHPITPTVNPECTWVIEGAGISTVKFDGSACLIQDGKLYKRYDRRPSKKVRRKVVGPFNAGNFKPAPEGWIPCEDEPNLHTGHWPGWVPVHKDSAEDKWHREAYMRTVDLAGFTILDDSTYELVGPKVQGNPYDLEEHQLWPHGVTFDKYSTMFDIEPPRDFDGLKEWFEVWDAIEGVVWYHPNGRMAKVKRTDFGLPWLAD